METHPELDAFRGQIEDWAESQLRPYIVRLRQRPEKSCLKGKEFNDAVWATVYLRPLEVLILDSPLLQRLRHIRQLGVVHLIYPSATHTRLDHSIGTVHQVSRLIAGINADEALIDDSLTSLLRVCALCHDVGHGVMSHVSENALANFRSTRKLLSQFSSSVKREQRKPSELAAYCIVGSPAFNELLTEAQRLSGEHQLPPDAAARMREAIIGHQISSEVPLAHELISGPFDGDKLDYITRDARMTGVPVVTDIPRLVQKVRGCRLPTESLPPDIRRSVPSAQAISVVTGVALSGGRTLDELVFGQTLLFDKLYRHQKVRAAETMVAAILDRIATLIAGGELMAPYAMVDAELLHLDRVGIERMAGRTLRAKDHKARIAVAVDISRRLRERVLFRRAYAFAQNMPLDPYRSDDAHRNGLIQLTRIARKSHERGALVDTVAADVRRILEILELESAIANLPGESLRPYIWIDPPKAQTQSNDTVRAYLLSDGVGGPQVMPFRDEFAETPGWSNAYLLTRDTGYVFTTDELALPVYLAVEKIFRLRFGVRTPELMMPYAKQNPDVVAAAKRRLAGAGFYDDAPYDIRPVPPEFGMANFPARLQTVRAGLEHYEGPVFEAQEQKHSTVMSSDRIQTFLQQFGPEYADEALATLERIKLVGREALVEALKAFVSQQSDRYASAVPLGDAKDSSSVTTYYAGDVQSLTVRSLGDALRRGDGIVFAEDFVGTGAQTISILEGLLDVPATTSLNEEREAPLPEGLRELFMKQQLAIVFASGTTAGAAAVEKAASRLGLNLDVMLHEEAAPALPDPAESAFAQRCEDIGRQLLSDTGHEAEWIRERALGYGNQGYLVVFPYNTPTQTLTCLWKSGKVDGIEWVPLVPRRPKR